jgi:hypothetical protein
MNTMLQTVSSALVMYAIARQPYFKQNCSSFCSLAVSLVKLCRCTVAMWVAASDARHVDGTTTMRSIRKKLEALVESAATCASRREDHEGHSSSCGGVKAVGTSTSASRTAATMRGKPCLTTVAAHHHGTLRLLKQPSPGSVSSQGSKIHGCRHYGVNRLQKQDHNSDQASLLIRLSTGSERGVSLWKLPIHMLLLFLETAEGIPSLVSSSLFPLRQSLLWTKPARH